MSKRWLISVFAVVVFCLSSGNPVLHGPVKVLGQDIEQKITVLSPIGMPPEIQLKPMAPRLDTLEGKTVYLVNDGYLGTDILLGEMRAWFQANMPGVDTVYKVKGGGGFAAEDPALWAEIKEKADAVVMGMGH
ncbi:MAG: hypothetical protein JXR49_20315 [Acidobacteria bacterium]|nr:hypothetical protein [Acidobacteriota bacterium]